MHKTTISNEAMASQLSLACQAGGSIADLAEQFSLGKASIRYWLKKFGLKTQGLARERFTFDTDKRTVAGLKICRLCEVNTGATYGGRSRWLCAGCYTKTRRARTKERAVQLLGGACCRCGWRGHLAGFDFHHTADDKEFDIGDAANKSWDVIKIELLKCELLCAICHRIEHSDLDNPKLLQLLKTYQGRELSI